jgi:hypothetical protein
MTFTPSLVATPFNTAVSENKNDDQSEYEELELEEKTTAVFDIFDFPTANV